MYAASGRLGFNEQQLQYAKDLLAVANIDKYLIEGIGFRRGFRSTDIAEKVRTFKLLTGTFGMIQNKLNEIDGVSGKFAREGFSVMDWAVNMPELHNQGEVILAILQNYYLEIQDENGNTVQVPIFDGETQEFVYKPGTLTLKDEYRTPENIRIWENFDTMQGVANPHLRFLFNAQIAVERLHGNYSETDKPGILNYTFGRIAMTFKKFMPENFANQYGKIEHDIIRGETNYEGRTRVLMRYYPSTALVLASIGFVTVAAVSVKIGVATGVGMLGYFGYKKFIQSRIKQTEADIISLEEQLKVGISTLTEIATRTIDRPLHALTRGRYRKLGDINNISRYVDSKLNMAISEKDRKILSESAQEVANNFYVMMALSKSLVVLRIIGEIILGVEPDDDEETYREKMRFIEYLSNTILNRYGMLEGDMTRNFNPAVLFDEARPTIAQTIMAGRSAWRHGNRYFDGRGDLLPFLAQTQRALPIMIPNMMADPFLRPGTTPLTTTRRWNDPWWHNDWTHSEEVAATRAVREGRDRLRREMVGIYTERFREELRNSNPEFQAQFASNRRERNQRIDYMANEAVRREMRERYQRRRQETHVEFYNRVNLHEERLRWRNGEAIPHFTLWQIEHLIWIRDQRRDVDRFRYELFYLDDE